MWPHTIQVSTKSLAESKWVMLINVLRLCLLLGLLFSVFVVSLSVWHPHNTKVSMLHKPVCAITHMYNEMRLLLAWVGCRQHFSLAGSHGIRKTIIFFSFLLNIMYQGCFYTSFQLHLHYWVRIELEHDENLSYLVNADVPSSEIRLPGHLNMRSIIIQPLIKNSDS